MSATVSASADVLVPQEFSDMLRKMMGVGKPKDSDATIEKMRVMENMLRERREDLEDYKDAKRTYDEFVASGEKGVPIDAVFKGVK